MNSNEYNYILTVAECCSIQKAADKLFVSSSTLSKYIASCEKKYHTKLFVYSDKQMRLTETGEMFVQRIHEIIALYDRMESEMHDIANYYSGKIRLGMPLNYNSDITNRAIIAFKNKYPFVTVSIIKGSDSEIELMLLHGEIDVLFDSSVHNSAMIEKKPIYGEELVLAVPKEHPLTKRAVRKKKFTYPWIDFRLAAQEPFIALPEKNQADGCLRNLAADCGVSVRRAIQITTIREAYQCVARGLGVAVVFASPQYVVESSDVELLSIGKEPVIQSHTIAYRKDIQLNETVMDIMHIYDSAHEQT